MSDLSVLSSRAVLGMYYARLENPALPWIGDISNLFGSDQGSETYAFLGQNPRMREWIGGRQAKGLKASSLTIPNRHYEATIEIALRDLRRDKTGQVEARIQEFADEGEAHWGTLLSALMLAAPSAVCYDGQYFFDTDHSEGDSGTQSNDLSVDISTLPATVHGTITAPSVEEMQQAIVQGIAAIVSFKDDRGRAMNTNARSFTVVTGVGLWMVALSAITGVSVAQMQQNGNRIAMPSDFSIRVEMNPELTWTDSFAIFRTDSPIKAFIRQNEQAPQLKMKDEMSEFAFDNDAIQIGIDAWRGADYGLWQRACYVTMV